MSSASLTSKFRQTSTTTKKKALPPLSFRVTEAERDLLKQAAGKRPVSAYIRSILFGDTASPRRHTSRRPSLDDAALGKALALLGQSRLASNLNQIAKGLNTGKLPINQDLQLELYQACADVRQMREALIEALNIKSME